MVGLIVGTLCLFALIATVRRRRYYAYRGHYHPRWGGYGRQRMGGRVRNPLHLLFARLDTTPGQEKAIVRALETLRERMAETRKELDAVSRELAVLIGGAVLDESGLDTVKARADALFGRFSADFRNLLALVHDALDEGQRRRFAELINDGSLFHAFCEQSSGFEHAAYPSCGHRYQGYDYAC
jgi:hypothetical protein